ncbi:alpha/beta fold hydrolase [Brevibacillus sp. B_LB10_24]|uniref:alpha/beta fold hydrolase n=1 Tax=Brevibacillus sp. B_LB10_24 TaxID=3380645 RepID=UPI0038BC277D
MKKRVVFIHSAGPQGHRQGSSDLIAYLHSALGPDYEVLHPQMPNPEKPEYVLWKRQLDQEFSAFDREVILIGHSLGGSVLLKYLSESSFRQPIAGLFCIAAPFWGEDEGWRSGEFVLQEDFHLQLPEIPRMFFYHSRGDQIVPYAHLGQYAAKFPQATVRTLEGVEHSFRDGIPQLVRDIELVGSRDLSLGLFSCLWPPLIT